MKDGRYQILLTNDDGIASPGLWAAAEALSELGFVTVVAPREQSSGTGRSVPVNSDGIIRPDNLTIKGQAWQVYAVGGTPAQAVLHGVLEIMDTRPDLVVSGINYGENIGNSITISGTVGAALEAASLGIPAVAASLELPQDVDYLGYSREVDFSSAAYFTKYFARRLLDHCVPPDVQILKVDVPYAATPQTDWRLTRLSRTRYFMPRTERIGRWEELTRGHIGYYIEADLENLEQDSDVYTLIFDHLVSVTPLTLDMTSRINFDDAAACLRK